MKTSRFMLLTGLAVVIGLVMGIAFRPRRAETPPAVVWIANRAPLSDSRQSVHLRAGGTAIANLRALAGAKRAGVYAEWTVSQRVRRWLLGANSVTRPKYIYDRSDDDSVMVDGRAWHRFHITDTVLGQGR